MQLFDTACSASEMLHNLNLYHYGVTAFVTIVFLLFFVLAIMLRKRLILSAMLFLLSFLLAGPSIVAANVFVEDQIRSVKITDVNVKRLRFVKAFVVTGTAKNDGKLPTKNLYIKVKFVKKSDSQLREFLNFYKPVNEQIFVVEQALNVGDSADFKILADTTRIKGLDSLITYTVYKAF